MSELRLRYQRDIYTDFIAASGLLILGEGLGAWELLKSFIECYADPKLLVFVLGLEPEEEQELLQKYTAGEHQLVGKVPYNVIKNDTLGPERARIYAGGGVISITSRIMLTDMLGGRLPVFLTTGICLYRAERITENCIEAFILHLFREQNQEGFIKAISEAPEPFTLGFNQLEKMMKWMKLPNNLLLYPRFHSIVKEELDEASLEIEELVLKASQRTTIVQIALVDLIDSCLKELVRLNPSLETVQIGEQDSMATLDALLGRQFDVLVKQQLEPVWHQIGFRTRQLVSELSTLRSLLHALYAFDAVTFLRYLETILDTEVGGNGPYGSAAANWIVLDSAHTLIQVSRDRVYNGQLDKPILEEPPKWKALIDLVKELSDEPRILIMTESESTRKQVELLVTHGVKPLLTKYFENYRAWSTASRTGMIPAVPARWPSRKRARKLPSVKEEEEETKQEKEESLVIGDEVLETQELLDVDLGNIVVRSYSEEHGLDILQAIKPTAIIMYTQNLAFIRSLELYSALISQGQLKVFSIYHKDSTEEQAYLLSVRREKNAFEALIKAKAQMVLPTEYEGKDANDDTGEDAVLLGRLAGRSVPIAEQTSAKKLIVDVRELRSSLPFVLHKCGAFKLIPETISIGDYLLTPDCAIERKAIPDLIQSLASGRLYTQAEALCRTYRQPMLLIEFDESRRAFSLLGTGDLRSEISGTDLISRLCLLLLHFPALKVIWSSSLLATAEIFADLQRDQLDPISPPSDLDLSSGEGCYNVTPKAMLEGLPGVNSGNLFKLMNAAGSMRGLCSMELASLQDLMGEANGRVLHDFLHTTTVHR